MTDDLTLIREALEIDLACCHADDTDDYHIVAALAALDRLERAITQIARQNVLRSRGSADAPGFEACVQAEMEEIISKDRKRDSALTPAEGDKQ